MRFITIWIFILVLSLQVYPQNKTKPKLKQKKQDSTMVNGVDSTWKKPRYGAFYHYGLNLYSANFSELPGKHSCCPEFTGGNGTGYSAGIIFELPLKTDINLTFRADYSTYSAKMTSTENTTVIVDGKSVPGEFEFLLDTRLASFGISPLITYNVWEKLNLIGGLRIGIVSKTNYLQKEEITQPSDRGVFAEEGTRTRNVYSGVLDDASSLHIFLSLGASYDFPLNKKANYIISPEVFYHFGINSVVSGLNWHPHMLRGGLALKYKQPPPPPPPPAPPLAPPMPKYPLAPVTPGLSVAVRATQIDSNNQERANVALKIEDFVSLNMRPLLNYVFFDYNSAEIPKRYKKMMPNQIDSFGTKQLQELDILPTYYNVLNIVGMRMKQDPEAKLTIVGTNCNCGEEVENTELSERRAMNVRNYLRDVWGIPEEQLSVESRDLPEEYSNPDTPEGDEENRRVELYPDNWSIIEPVITIDTIRNIEKSTVRFYPTAKTSTGIDNWTLNVKQKNRQLVEFTGSGKVPKSIDWDIMEKDSSSPKSGGKIEYSFAITDKIGQYASTPPQTLNCEQLTIDKKRVEGIADKEFEYYSLILFDYGKSKLGTEHKKVVDFVQQRVTSESNVIISGYTDSMGDEDINKKLAEERAEAVAKRLDISGASIEGVGEDEILYDNSLPEGRFYCRTVKITIETPVNHKTAEPEPEPESEPAPPEEENE